MNKITEELIVAQFEQINDGKFNDMTKLGRNSFVVTNEGIKTAYPAGTVGGLRIWVIFSGETNCIHVAYRANDTYLFPFNGSIRRVEARKVRLLAATELIPLADKRDATDIGDGFYLIDRNGRRKKIVAQLDDMTYLYQVSSSLELVYRGESNVSRVYVPIIAEGD